MRYLALTETPYQQAVIMGCTDLNNILNIHWDIRGVSEKGDRARTVKTRVGFFFHGFISLFKTDALVLGDFRSFIQLCMLGLANFMGKKVFIAEDGIINLVADAYNYDTRFLDDGGLTDFKKKFLPIFERSLRNADRITTEPDFVRAIRPQTQVHTSLLELEAQGVNVLPERRILVFVGQHLESMGVSREIQLQILEKLRHMLGHQYDAFFYSPHPRSDGINADVESIDWSIIGPLSQLPSKVIDFDLAGFHSTALLNKSYQKVHKYIVPLEGKFDPNTQKQAGQLRVQQTIIKVLDASDCTYTVLDI